jgi:hypothetical protein
MAETKERLRRIAEWQARMGRSHYQHESYAALVELLVLCAELSKEKIPAERSLLFDVFALRAVANIEVFIRVRLKEIIDHGSPYLENAAKLSDKIKLDHLITSALQKRMVTVGDLIAHEVPISSHWDLVRHFDTVCGGGFKRALVEAKSPSADEQTPDEQTPIIRDFERLFSSLNRLFEIRHKLAHEAGREPIYKQEELPELLSAAATYVAACDEVISFRLHGPQPRTQSGLNSRRAELLVEAEQQLAAEIIRAKASGNVDPDDFDEAQAAWKEFAVKEASLHAALVPGGSMGPMVYANSLTDLTKSRLERVKWWSELEEGNV